MRPVGHRTRCSRSRRSRSVVMPAVHDAVADPKAVPESGGCFRGGDHGRKYGHSGVTTSMSDRCAWERAHQTAAPAAIPEPADESSSHTVTGQRQSRRRTSQRKSVGLETRRQPVETTATCRGCGLQKPSDIQGLIRNPAQLLDASRLRKDSAAGSGYFSSALMAIFAHASASDSALW